MLTFLLDFQSSFVTTLIRNNEWIRKKSRQKNITAIDDDDE